jgi:deoxyadenosine/deoxycytidine kinase
MSYISLSGNIAVGKSTALQGLKDLGYNVVFENLGPEFLGLLAAYNINPLNAIHLQSYINDYRLSDAEDSTNSTDLFIHERSMIDDMVFTTYMVAKGEITEAAGVRFLELATERLIANPPEKVIYLYSDPETTYSRLVSRGRSQESEQTLLSIAELEQAHLTILPIICEELGIELVELEWSNFGNILRVVNLI